MQLCKICCIPAQIIYKTEWKSMQYNIAPDYTAYTVV